jgi:hypothetical protein
VPGVATDRESPGGTGSRLPPKAGILRLGLGAGGIPQQPVRLAISARGRVILDLGEVAGLEMRPVDLIHLLLDVFQDAIALLRGEQAVVSIPESRTRMMVLQRRVDFVAQQFVESLGHGGERFEIRIIERPDWRMVEHV